MRIVLLGPPGSGKSAIAQKIASEYCFPVISVEEVAEELSIMAKEDDEWGRLARESIGAGRVSDDVCNVVVTRVLGRDALEAGFVLVGYPKDAAQAEYIEESMNRVHRPIDLVMMIDIDRDELMERRVGRISCDSCGEQYNLYVNPPMVEGVCDVCGSRVNRRPQGYEENISNQLREYDLSVEQILAFYRAREKLRLVDGNGTEDELWNNVKAVIDTTERVEIQKPVENQLASKKKLSVKKKPAAKKKASVKKSVKDGSAKKKQSKASDTKSLSKKAAVTKKKASKKKAAKKVAGMKTASKKAAAKKAAVKKTVTKKTTAKKKVAKKKTTVSKKAASRKKAAANKATQSG